MSKRVSDNSDIPRSPKVKKEENLQDEVYFMELAHLTAKKNKSQRAGACIVSEDSKIVGLGNDEVEYGTEFHAEMNAIINRSVIDIKNCSIYVTRFPCNECIKMIIQARINKIIYLSMDNVDTSKDIDTIPGIKMLKSAGVKYERYNADN